MEQSKRGHLAKWPGISPWIILVAVLGAMLLAAIMFNRDYRRERGHLKDMFLQRGEVLIHSLELVGRVRFSSQWEEAHLLSFWNNLEASDNVLFLTLTDEKGQPLAQAGELTPDPSVFADPQPQVYGEGPSPIAPNYRLEKIGDRWVYLIYRSFWPMPRPQSAFKGGRRHSPGHQRRSGPNWNQPQGRGPMGREFPLRYMWVGFDLNPFEKISHSRVRTAAVFIGLFCLAGLAGVLALIWGHSSRLARQMYQDTNALAAELIGRLPTGVIIIDSQERITLVNRSTLNISGLTESDFLGRTLPELAYSLFPQEETLAGRELDLEFNGGHKVRVALTSGPVISYDGHPLGRVILMEDLGELGRLRAELGNKERLAVLGRLAAGLAHEIRNPLGAIRGLSQHLLSKGPGDPADREALEVMLASVDRLNSTITDFLAYARPTEAKPETLELAELLRKMSVLAAHDARAGEVEVVLDLPEEPVLIDGDEALLSQAFLNLYLNAIEAAGGRGNGGGRLTVTLKTHERRALLSFRDNGPGFSPEQLAQPFVPYFTTKAEGTGLGLALVEKTIRAHEGSDISLASSPGGGALISIYFSLKADQPEREPMP